MSWALVEGWTVVAGALLLTTGTGAQAWENLARYRSHSGPSRKATRRAFWDALLIKPGESPGIVLAPLMPPPPIWLARKFWYKWLPRALFQAVVRTPQKMTQIQQDAGDDAVEWAQLLRSTGLWTVLMAGSALVLTGAAVHLALAYTGSQ